MDVPQTPADMPQPSGASRLSRALDRFGGAAELDRSRYFARWTALAILVGIAAGLGAITFFWMIEVGVRFFLGHLVGYLPPAPFGEGNHPETTMARAWALPLVVGLGGLLSGLLVFLLAPEAEGHGTDAAIEAFHERAGKVRARIIPIKTLASAITIGSGGSAGREGPAAQISAGIGSLLGSALHLNANDRRILVATGIGAGIGAIFRAPLGGAVLAAEILYIHDLEIEALFPGLIASIVGYSIFGSWAGWDPIFGAQPELGFTNAAQLIYYAALGLVCGLVGVLYAKSFYGLTDYWRRLRLPNWLKPAIAGLLVGLLGLAVPGVISTGYGWLQMGMSDRLLELPLWIVLILPFAKILATSLSIGSGGSGGIFGPGMVIGGFVGAAFWRLAELGLPGVPASPAAFTIVAMMALFGGIAHAPLAMMLMVAEMTGNLSLLAPAMIAVGLATLVAGDNTIYRSQLPTRADSPAHRYRFSFPLLGSLTVQDAITPASALLAPSDSAAEAAERLDAVPLSGIPVTEGRRLAGVVSRADLADLPPEDRGTTPVASIMTREPVTATPETSLDVALERLSEHGVSWLPVVDGQDDTLLGVVSAADIVRAYRTATRWTIRRLRGLTLDTILLESRLAPGSWLVGRSIRELKLPSGGLVVSVLRDGTTILPHGDTELRAGDVVTVLTSPESEQLLREFLGTDHGSPNGTSPAAGEHTEAVQR